MSSDDNTTDTGRIEDRLKQVGRYSRFVKAGLGVIVGAFLLAAVTLLPENLDSAASAVNAILLPLIFVGMGLLLFGIGMHLHLMHLNLVRQLRKSEETDQKSSERERD
ncbi:hypothetical protein ACFQMA_18655 [Halosimplex aquaticum]|uniref:Solute:sodium symporter small subunit n=1 Tax=Halosimplex aquaticum TaxID=3026162 RepID=A0ABD5Y380_9EURY|nr:hypothetical protein [Halosimplex aquaticum]